MKPLLFAFALAILGSVVYHTGQKLVPPSVHPLVLLIEVGFLLAYRWGGSLQWSAVAVNGAAALLLVPIALAVFKESFSPVKGLGILLVLGGLALLSRR